MSEEIFNEYRSEFTDTVVFLLCGWTLTVTIAFILGFEGQRYKHHADKAWAMSFVFYFFVWLLASFPGHKAATETYLPGSRFIGFQGFRIFFSLALIMFAGLELQRHQAQAVYGMIFGILAATELWNIKRATGIFITNTTQTE